MATDHNHAEAPTITVLMAVYNGEEYLRPAIDSILSQTFRDFELVIINDCSTDGTEGILESYDDRRIVRIDNAANRGLTKSLNIGIERAQGKYLARMDADDVAHPRRLETQLRYLEEHGDTGVVGSIARLIDGQGRQGEVIRYPLEPGHVRWTLCFSNAFVHPSVMIRTDLLKQVSGYDTRIMYAQDYDLWCRLSRVTKLANLDEVLTCLRRHEKAISRSKYSQQLASACGTSQRYVSAILGENVAPDVIENIYDLRNKRGINGRAESQIVYRLYKTMSTGDLTAREKRNVRIDAINLLLDIGRVSAGAGEKLYACNLALRVNVIYALVLGPIRLVKRCIRIVTGGAKI